MRQLFAAVFGLAACGAPTAATPPPRSAPCPTCPETAPAPGARPFHWPALVGDQPAPDAPPELAQFGRLVGVWSCTGEQRQPDGSFKPSAGESSWTWFYTLGGRAVQDIWEPAKGPVGTNLRIYDPESRSWVIQWTTGARSWFEQITARADGASIVMRGEVTRASAVPPHARKITFTEITADSFRWSYEATKPNSDSGWREVARMSCRRTGDLETAWSRR